MKIILKCQVKIFGCLIFLMGIVSCDSDPCALDPCEDPCVLIPCDSDPTVQLDPTEGNGTAATPTLPDSFEFYLNDEIDTPFENGVDMKLAFDYNTAPPGNVRVGFIQIVRTVNLCDGRYIYPTVEKRRRATDQGWYLDRADGYKSGIYGQIDMGDRRGYAESYASWGTKTDPAYMEDVPYRPENRPNLGIRWQAICVPVDINIDHRLCDNPKLGYYYWSWTVTEFGALKNIEHGIANSSVEEDVNDALIAWNSHQTGPGWGCIAAAPPPGVTAVP